MKWTQTPVDSLPSSSGFVEHGFETVNEMKSHLNKKGDEPQIRHA